MRTASHWPVGTWLLPLCLLIACAEQPADTVSPEPASESALQVGQTSPVGQTAPAGQSVAAGQAAGERVDGLPFDPVLEETLKRGIETRISSVDFVAASSLPAVTSVLPEAERVKLADVPLPVLLPQVPLDSLFAAIGADWYSATVQFDGITLLVTGNRREVVHPSLPAAELATTAKPGAGPLAIEGYRLSRTHQVVTVSFRAFGAAYKLDVECAAPTSDLRCTGDDYAIGLAETLAVLGGGAP